MAKHWRCLTTSVGVKFNVLLLCRILHLLARNNSHLSSARTLAAELLEEPYQLSLEDYLNMVEIFGQERLFEELKKLHYSMTRKGLHPDLQILTEIAKYTEDLGDWVFCLFKDILHCSSSDQDSSCKLAVLLLDKVSDKLLSSKRCLLAVLHFLEAFPPFSKRINSKLFRRLSHAIEGCQLWSPLLVFLEQCVHLWSSLPKSSICRPLELAVEQGGVSSMVVRVVELLSKGQRSSLNNQTWEKIILWCVQQRMTQKASSFYKFISSTNGKLSSEGTVQLAEELQSQGSSGLAMTVLRDGLQRLPPVIPPLALLTEVATSRGVVNTTQELFPVVATLVRRHVAPPEELLNLVLSFVSKEKCYSKLSELVRVSMKCNVKIGHTFYKKAAAELEQWGQDPDSARLATILFRGESTEQGQGEVKKKSFSLQSSEEKGGDVERMVGVETSGNDVCEGSGEVDDGGVKDMDIDSLSGDSVAGGTVIPPATPTQPELLMLPLQSWVKSGSVSTVPAEKLSPVATVGESSSSSISDSVRECSNQRVPHFLLAHSPPPAVSAALGENSSSSNAWTTPRTTPPELLTLIQTNGRMGQFRAVTSILVDLESTASWYDDSLVLSIWDILATSQAQKPAAAFQSFLNHLDRSRSSGINQTNRGGKSGPGSSLLSSDRWLASQLGIGLIRLHEQKKDLHGGYSVLQTLHFFKIPYISLSQPPSNLPLLVFSPPTPCSIAIMAANLCLRIQNGTASAMEVLSSSNWVEAEGEEEELQRLELILSVARSGLGGGMLSEVKTCLEKVVACKNLPEKYTPEINDLYNRLLLAVLEKADCNSAMATSVYEAINNNQLHCRPRTFSLLVKQLCENEQTPRAEEFCLQAITGNRYPPLYNGSPYEITFPPGVTQLEAQLLLQQHVKSLSMNSEGGKRNLILHLATGTRAFFEGVAGSLTPPLGMTCRGKDAVISGECLVSWRESNPSPASRHQGGSVTEANGTAKPKPTKVCINRKAKAASEQMLRKQQEDSIRREFASSIKPYRSKFSSQADYKHVIRLLSASYFKTSQKFREARQAASASAQLGIAESWEVPPISVREEIGQIVTNFVAKFTVYSMEMDRELGLCASHTSSFVVLHKDTSVTGEEVSLHTTGNSSLSFTNTTTS